MVTLPSGKSAAADRPGSPVPDATSRRCELGRSRAASISASLTGAIQLITRSSHFFQPGENRSHVSCC